VLVVALVLVAGCSDDGDGDGRTVTAAEGAGAEPELTILVASGAEVLRWSDGDVERVAEVDGEVAVAYGDGHGTVVAEVDGALVDVASGGPRAIDVGAPGRVLLFDVVTIDGAPTALLGVRDESQGEPAGDIALVDLATGARRGVATGYAVEHHTFAGSVGGGMASVSAYSDLTESVTLYPIEEGRPDPVWSPTIDLPYNAPPLVLDAILSPDGERIAWLSGPEAPGDAPDGGPAGTWEVVVAAVDGTGQERIPLGLADGTSAVRLDHDGERVLVSTAVGDAPGAPLLIDLADGSTQRLDGITGVATFDG